MSIKFEVFTLNELQDALSGTYEEKLTKSLRIT